MNDDDLVTLRAPDGARACIHPDGAHVVSWQPAGGDEWLYLSPQTKVGDGAAIRGGIPVIFPQFASEGPLPKHGFARNRRWRLDESSEDIDGTATATFVLTDDERTRAIWPHSFVAALTARVAGTTLSVALRIDNHGASAFAFTAALHTYLAVEEIAQASLVGLKGVRYRDAADGNRYKVEQDEVVRIVGEVDRVYEDAPTRVAVRTPGRRLDVVSVNLPDTVVWNPGPVRCAALPDMPADGYRRMLCVESAVIATPVVLPVGASWTGSQTLVDCGREGSL